MKRYSFKLTNVLNRMGAWLVVLVIVVLLSIFTDTFLTLNNITNVLRQTSVVSIIALGVSFVILGGEIDLSSGMVSTFVGCSAALMMMKLGFSIVVSVVLAVMIGVIFGTLIGYIVTYLKISSFIATLGASYIYQGLVLVTTNSFPVTGLPDSFLTLGRGYIANIIPVPVLIMFLFFAAGQIILKYTPFGRSVISIGENTEAAKLSGLNVNRTKVLIFVIAVFCSAVAGIVQTARLSSGQPTSGGDLTLQAIAAVYIGGTFNASMMNTLAGALAWGFVSNGLNLLSVSAYWQKVVLGVIIIFAVLFDSFRSRMVVSRKTD